MGYSFVITMLANLCKYFKTIYYMISNILILQMQFEINALYVINYAIPIIVSQEKCKLILLQIFHHTIFFSIR